MILVFGGTTEGRMAVKELEEAGFKYYYSTKTGEQQLSLHNGIMVSGGMDAQEIESFCSDNEIKLIIDAAHPFAEQLHKNISQAAKALNIKVIRFERIYPPRNPHIVWCEDFADAIEKMKGVKKLLSTAGVQSIAKLKPLQENGVEIYHRILERESSMKTARENGVNLSHLRFYNGAENSSNLFSSINPDAVLVKESGETGGEEEKILSALKLGIKVFALKRPSMPEEFITVNGPYGMRRMVEKLLPGFYPLHSGLTTGSCATASAVASAIALMEREFPKSVKIALPDGEDIDVEVFYKNVDENETSNTGVKAYVIKDSGDDPDVTDKMEICAEVERTFGEEIQIFGGEGIGKITLPGFDYPPGESAINKAPREMIRSNLAKLFPGVGFKVTISVPGGEEIAHRTFNPRLGIVGGISIIGVSGIIKPFSEESFVGSIRKCMEVAKASGKDCVVINSGAKSEGALKEHFKELPSQCFVQYGNKIGESIKIAVELGIKNINLGIMLGKAVKLAAGNLDTHSSNVTMDRDFIAELLKDAGCAEDIVNKAYTITLARELWSVIPLKELRSFIKIVIEKCTECCKEVTQEAHLSVLLIDENNKIYS